jgi:anti-sigma factor ChrR (cupin superfamily)
VKRCDQAELVCAYALHVLPSVDVMTVEGHLSSCPQCRQRLVRLRPIVDTFLSRPSDLLQPSNSVQERLARRIGVGASPTLAPWSEPAWEEVAPGISCKILATDAHSHRVTMLVRLAPDTEYPAHTHAGVEELHLLNGELWIDGRKLVPGDYNRAEAGTTDRRVWSETGCTCLLITSTRDALL